MDFCFPFSPAPVTQYPVCPVLYYTRQPCPVTQSALLLLPRTPSAQPLQGIPLYFTLLQPPTYNTFNI